jgi:hypothetical protein
MGRIIQPKGSKGSLRWIQHVVNDCPEVLWEGYLFYDKLEEIMRLLEKNTMLN